MKINGKNIKAQLFAYDGCHKIYILETKNDIVAAANAEYRILPMRYIQETYAKSCNLRFIDFWNENKPSIVPQFEAASFD